MDEWIKPAEKLPEPYEDVLCWYEYFRYGSYNRLFKRYGVGFVFENGVDWGGDVCGHKVTVIAWMPLPKPPKYRVRRKNG